MRFYTRVKLGMLKKNGGFCFMVLASAMPPQHYNYKNFMFQPSLQCKQEVSNYYKVCIV